MSEPLSLEVQRAMLQQERNTLIANNADGMMQYFAALSSLNGRITLIDSILAPPQEPDVVTAAGEPDTAQNGQETAAEPA